MCAQAAGQRGRRRARTVDTLSRLASPRACPGSLVGFVSSTAHAETSTPLPAYS